jgi:hypothetical protein
MSLSLYFLSDPPLKHSLLKLETYQLAPVACPQYIALCNARKKDGRKRTKIMRPKYMSRSQSNGSPASHAPIN